MSFAKPFVKREEDDGGYAALMCKAHDCPNRWAVSSSMLCGAHAWADPKQWAHITTGELQAFARRSWPKPPKPEAEPMTDKQKMEIVKSLRNLTVPLNDSRAWAKKLKERELAGEVLSIVQQKAWRGALHESF